MPTQEQINEANVELQIANDNYAALANQYNRYKNVFQEYANASPEAQERAKDLMQDALARYEQIKLDMYAAEDRIAQAQRRVNNINAEIQAAQEAAQQAAAWWRRVINPSNTTSVDLRWDLLWYLPPSYRGWGIRWLRQWQGGTQTTVAPEETWEDIYNAWWWNEFKKWFNNALVDDAVLPIARAFWASDDTLWVLSELKIPATEREMASKYYALWWWGKDATDAYLQYACMRAIWSIPELVWAWRWAWTTYTVANSWRWIYNTPNARRTVNRAWSNYTPAYWWNWVRNLKSSGLPNLSFTSLW